MGNKESNPQDSTTLIAQRALGLESPEIEGPPQGPKKKKPVYQLIRRLGKGQFGTVWQCRLKDDPDKMFALKVLSCKDQDDLDRATVEVQALSSLRDLPNVVSFHGVFPMQSQRQGTTYAICILMDYLEGAFADFRSPFLHSAFCVLLVSPPVGHTRLCAQFELHVGG